MGTRKPSLRRIPPHSVASPIPARCPTAGRSVGDARIDELAESVPPILASSSRTKRREGGDYGEAHGSKRLGQGHVLGPARHDRLGGAIRAIYLPR